MYTPPMLRARWTQAAFASCVATLVAFSPRPSQAAPPEAEGEVRVQTPRGTTAPDTSDPAETADATEPGGTGQSRNADPFGLDEVYADPAPVAPPPPQVEADPPPVGEEGQGLTDMAGQPADSLLDTQSADLIPLNRVLAPPTGKKMMIAGGIVYGIGFLGQLGGWSLIRRTCASTPAESVQQGDFGSAVSCGAGFAGGGLLLFLSGIPEFVGAPWIVAGATFNGKYRAFDDHFFKGMGATRGKKMGMFIWGGAGLIAAGALSWIISPAIAVRSCRESPRLTCSVDATTWGFNLGLGAMTAGGAMLGHGLAYRRSFGRYRMLTPVSVAPSFGRNHAGLSLSGRF